MKKILVLLIMVIFLIPACHAQITVEPQELVQIDLPNYSLATPVQITVSYTYTQDYSINVSTFTQPRHQEISEPEGITFKTNDPDVYTIHIWVRYDVWVNQTITLTMFQANQTGQIIQFATFSKGFDIDMVVSVSNPPTIPTAEENAAAFYKRFSGDMETLFQHEQMLSGTIMDANLFLGSLAAISFVGMLAMLVVVIYVVRRQAKLEGLVKRRET